jgi:hypothetical protein
MSPSRTSGSQVIQNERDVGRWEVLPYDSQIEAVHMALLHNGKVLYYSGFRFAEARKTETRVWYPKTGEIKSPSTPGDLFCAGHSFLPDGRLLSTGGTLASAGVTVNVPHSLPMRVDHLSTNRVCPKILRWSVGSGEVSENW